MTLAQNVRAVDYAALDDVHLVEGARNGEAAAFRGIMKRHNRRLYRVARGVLGDDAEAEDVVQEAYLKGFQNLQGFRGDSTLATWLTRIALNEALGRRRRRRPMVNLIDLDTFDEQREGRVLMFPGARADSDPESETSRAQIRRLLEQAVDGLPEAFRLVFVLRDIEQMTIEETASQLEIRPETVKTRLHRARRLLRDALRAKLGSVLDDAYAFDGARCESMTEAVLQRLHLPATDNRT
ncbi:MAG TPA: RNA polymerase sigma factor [Bauldia sp.]|nr:RNA polymerase sigma factor [Bauldia sp.]